MKEERSLEELAGSFKLIKSIVEAIAALITAILIYIACRV